jgi:hypothetical protein
MPTPFRARHREKTLLVRLKLLGVGAMNSPRYAPAGLLVGRGRQRVMIDGGPSVVPSGRLDAWLVTDERDELMSKFRKLARARGLEPHVGSYNLAPGPRP